jgi:hypothetical protein
VGETPQITPDAPISGGPVAECIQQIRTWEHIVSVCPCMGQSETRWSFSGVSSGYWTGPPGRVDRIKMVDTQSHSATPFAFGYLLISGGSMHGPHCRVILVAQYLSPLGYMRE